jgi:hypothetical protein
MTIAAAQCREWVERHWPDAPISRLACRNTASGGISQHSAYGSPRPVWSSRTDSNALDIFAPGHGSDPASQAYIQEIVDALLAHGEKWSIRRIIWKDGGAHENHAHVDYYPMITVHKWCGNGTPTWRYSDGSTVTTRDPVPEHGRYDGPESEDLMPETQWHQLIDTLFSIPEADGGLAGDPDYWKQLPEDSDEWHRNFWPAVAKLWAHQP